jgi:lipopolysaccharide export LptBFGC system permease protein LptF
MSALITIDKYNMFPWVAWTILISFALFVGNLTLIAKAEIEALETQATWSSEQPLYQQQEP